MADWRQIQARIRKAKAGADPPGQLKALFEKTRDAMVAFELAQFHERSGQDAEAARWYSTAAQRFRRAQWKTKAAEALARLGVSAPAAPSEQAPAAGEVIEAGPAAEPEQLSVEAPEEFLAHPLAPLAGGVAAGAEPRKHRRRRGRRGGRRRHRGERARPGAAPSAEVSRAQSVAAERPQAQPVPRREERRLRADLPAEGPAEPPPALEPMPEAARPSRSRAGEPALASRMAQLESQLRRLLACPLYRLDEAEQAPAGPGVFILSDSDQVTNYYVEACQTLRVGVGNLLRGGRGSREMGALRAQLAEHLGINEARVSKYLKDHCTVRWLQLDEGAPHLAHFAVAVLRPVVNE